MLMETDFVLDTGGNDDVPKSIGILYNSSETALTDNNSNSEIGDKLQPQQNFRRVGSSIRYHENDKFSKIKPGRLSYDLRRALGISSHDIPLHVYRMRSLGYPPGWLRKAKVELLPSFDEDGKLNQNGNDSYNEDALIAFPGFNVYSSNLVDRCYEFKCPRMRSAHLLENFIDSLNKSSEKTRDLSLFKRSLENKDLTDLELERQRILSEMKALSAETSLHSVDDDPQSEKEVIDLTENSEELVDLSSNPNISEIPIDSTPSSSSPKVDFESEDRDIKLESVEVLTNGGSSKYRIIGVGINEHILNNTEATSEHSHENQVGLVSMSSTSIPDLPPPSNSDGVSSNSSLTTVKLPSLEAFSSGIQPYVPFENLPNTQGGYSRVRNTLKRIKNSGDVSIIVEETNSNTSKSSESDISTSPGRSSDSVSSRSKDKSSHSITHRRSPSKSDRRSQRSTNESVGRPPNEVSRHYSPNRSHRSESSRASNDDYRGRHENTPLRRYEQRSNLDRVLYPPAIPFRDPPGYGHSRGPYPRAPPSHNNYPDYLPSFHRSNYHRY